MNIATALNQKYINYTIVMLTSLCENNPIHINAYLLHSELSENNIQYMKPCLDKYSITLIPIAIDQTIFHNRFPRNDMWSLEAYYRLLLIDYLPISVDRILYLDVDLIINKSLEEYYTIDFESSEIITCIDSCGKSGWEKRSEKQRQMFAQMIESGYQYFNAGVMLLNITAMREKYNFDYYLQAIEKWNYEMSILILRNYGGIMQNKPLVIKTLFLISFEILSKALRWKRKYRQFLTIMISSHHN